MQTRLDVHDAQLDPAVAAAYDADDRLRRTGVLSEEIVLTDRAGEAVAWPS